MNIVTMLSRFASLERTDTRTHLSAVESERDHFARDVRHMSLRIVLVLYLWFSTLLKSDQWLSESYRVSDSVRGAINFRNIPGTNIYASGQPTESAIDEVVHRVKGAHPNASKVVWVTLREEPIVYINGAPYCLRRERFSLRNMKGLHAEL